jgi:hypothetical protein
MQMDLDIFMLQPDAHLASNGGIVVRARLVG